MTWKVVVSLRTFSFESLHVASASWGFGFRPWLPFFRKDFVCTPENDMEKWRGQLKMMSWKKGFQLAFPIASRYGIIFTDIYHKHQLNKWIYNQYTHAHGSMDPGFWSICSGFLQFDVHVLGRGGVQPRPRAPNLSNLWWNFWRLVKYQLGGWQLKHVWCSTLPGEMIQFD